MEWGTDWGPQDCDGGLLAPHTEGDEMKQTESVATKTVLKITVPHPSDNSFVQVSVIDEHDERYVIIEDPNDDSWVFPITSKDHWPLISFAITTALKLCKN